jgi:hypothetical protein
MLYVARSIVLVFLVGLIYGCTAPAPTVTSAPKPTLPPPTPTIPESPAGPAEVVQGFWDAMDAGDLDAVMAFFADDVQLRGRAHLNSKESVLSYVQGRFSAVFIVEIHDLQVEGDTVSFLVDYYSREGGTIQASDVKDVMIVQNGKIIYWEIG